MFNSLFGYLNGNNYRYPLTEKEGDLFEFNVYGQDIGPGSGIFILNKD